MCPNCRQIHWNLDDEVWCRMNVQLHNLVEETRYEEIEDADINNPPDWIVDLDFPPVIYSRYNPNASWSLPK